MRPLGPRGFFKISLLVSRLWYAATLFLLSPSVGEKWMRDERTPKDVCGEAIVTLVLIRILYPAQVGCRRLGSLLQLHRSRYAKTKEKFVRVGRRGLGIFSFNLIPRDCDHFGHLINLILGRLKSKSCWVLDLGRPKEKGGLCPEIKEKFCLIIDALFLCRFHQS